LKLTSLKLSDILILTATVAIATLVGRWVEDTIYPRLRRNRVEVCRWYP